MGPYMHGRKKPVNTSQTSYPEEIHCEQDSINSPRGPYDVQVVANKRYGDGEILSYKDGEGPNTISINQGE
jgi:hypothetical protein